MGRGPRNQGRLLGEVDSGESFDDLDQSNYPSRVAYNVQTQCAENDVLRRQTDWEAAEREEARSSRGL
jgi:hypothetical protein